MEQETGQESGHELLLLRQLQMNKPSLLGSNGESDYALKLDVNLCKTARFQKIQEFYC